MQAAEDIDDEPNTERTGAEPKSAERTRVPDDTAIASVLAVAPMDAAGATHPGRMRLRNEDAFAVATDLGLAVVADGMGGHPSGDVASCLAVGAVESYLRRAADSLTLNAQDNDDTASQLTIGLLTLAVQDANRAIHNAAMDIQAHKGMGTTIAALLIVRGFAFYAHVGDSRIYRYRAGALVQLTEDHSVAAEYRRSRGAAADPLVMKRHESTLTRCLGTYANVRVSLNVERYEPGDLYLLCSDGLWGAAGDETIARVLREESDPHGAAHWLIDEANTAGGPDNITAIVVRPLFSREIDAPEP